MRPRTRLIGHTARSLLPLALLLALGALPIAPTALASGVRHPSAALGAVVLHVEATQAPAPLSRLNPNKPAITRVAAGHFPRIALYAFFTNVTSRMKVRVSITGRQAGRLVFKSTGTYTVGRAQLRGATSGWQVYRNNIGVLTKKPGVLSFTGVVSAGGVTRQRTTTLTVF